MSVATLTELLTPEDVAEITGLALDTLAQWRSRRRGIPYLKIGRAVRYDPAEVQAYLERCRVSVSDPQGRRRRRALTSEAVFTGMTSGSGGFGIVNPPD